MGQQALVQLAGQQRNAGHTGVVAEPMTGEADLAAATGHQDLLIEIGPLLDGVLTGSLRPGARGERHRKLVVQSYQLRLLERSGKDCSAAGTEPQGMCLQEDATSVTAQKPSCCNVSDSCDAVTRLNQTA